VVFHLTTAFLEDADGLLITPIVNDPFEKIVSPLGTDLKNACGKIAALRESLDFEALPRRECDMGEICQYTPEFGTALENRSEKTTVAAADIHDSPAGRKIIRRDDGGQDY
jgi:hypothetical protein